jgi:hypothetical protein
LRNAFATQRHIDFDALGTESDDDDGIADDQTDGHQDQG